jgi:ribosome-associated protein
MKQKVLESAQLAAIAIKGLEEIKGQDIILMDLRKVESAICDYFVICTGTSDRHTQALADSVIEMMREAKEKPVSREGYQLGEWVLLDYISVIIHIFQKDKREFYRLEDLWGDAKFKRVDVSK